MPTASPYSPDGRWWWNGWRWLPTERWDWLNTRLWWDGKRWLRAERRPPGVASWLLWVVAGFFGLPIVVGGWLLAIAQAAGRLNGPGEQLFWLVYSFYGPLFAGMAAACAWMGVFFRRHVRTPVRRSRWVSLAATRTH